MKPTNRQLEVLATIARHQLREGLSPSIRGLADLLGIVSTNGMNDHLKALEKKGLLERDHRARSIRLTPAGRQALHQTHCYSCGQPLPVAP